LMRGHLAEARHWAAETLNPQPPIRVQHDLDDAGVSKGAKDQIAQFPLKLLPDAIGIIGRVTFGGHAGTSAEVERELAYMLSGDKVNDEQSLCSYGIWK
jgi:hypothetical protein